MATPALRIRIAPKFPTKQQAGVGLAVSRTGGVVTYRQDWSAVQDTITPPDGAEVLIRDPDDNQLYRTDLLGLGDLIRPVASQPEAEAGSNNTKTMTPLRTKQSVVANAKSGVWEQDDPDATPQSILDVLRTLEVTPEQFGAKNDGTTADDAAFDKAYNFLMRQPNGGTLRLLSGVGYRLNAEHNIHPSKPLRIRWDTGAWVYSGLTGADKVLLKGTHPTDPSTRGKQLILSDGKIAFHPSVPTNAVGAVHFEHRFASDLKFVGEHEWLHYRNNTAVSVSGLFNCDGERFTSWGAGVNFLHKAAEGVQFSITYNTKTLTSSVPHFDSGDVGKAIMLSGYLGLELHTIASVEDSITATTVDAAGYSIIGGYGVWEGVRGSMDSGSATLILSKNVLSTADVGRVVYVLGARSSFNSGKRPLRARIVSVAGTTVTLDTEATETVSSVYVVFSPAVEFFDEGLVGDNYTNDFVWADLHIEQFRGTGLVVEQALNLFLDRCKLHAQNGVLDETSSMFCGIFSGCNGWVSGEMEGMAVNNLGRLYHCDIPSGWDIKGFTGIQIEHQTQVYAENCRADSFIGVGNISCGNDGSEATAKRAVKLVGVGQLDHYGAVSTNGRALITPSRRVRKHVFGKTMPPVVSGRLVAAAEDEKATVEAVSVDGYAPEFRGTAYGGTFSAPATVGDYQPAMQLTAFAYTATWGLNPIGGVQIAARSPTSTYVSSEMTFQTSLDGAVATRWGIASNGDLFVGADNAYDIGYGGGRVKQIVTANAVIVTSDENAKQDIDAIPDEWLDAWGDIEWVRYRLKASVAEKGDDARWHVGLLAQRVRDAFAAHGIDAFAIGLLCYDEWSAEAARDAVVGEGGEVVSPACPGREAGSLFGLRYEECYAMEAAWSRREQARKDERVAKLETILAAVGQ